MQFHKKCVNLFHTIWIYISTLLIINSMAYCSNAVGDYAPIFLDSLLVYLQPLIEKTVAKKLHLHCFGRIYYNGSNLTRHVDQEGRNEYGSGLLYSKTC